MPGPSSVRDIPVPGSPALSATSSNIGPHLPPHLRPSVIVTRKDQAASLDAYEALLTSSKSYTQALLTLANASNEFAGALQECSRLKGAHKIGSQLQAASGLEYLVSNHSKLLADSFWKDFSIPLLESFDDYRRNNAERQLSHEKVMAERSRELKDCEDKNLRGAANAKRRGGKERDLGSFRRALEELQRLVDGLDEERAGHYVEVLAAEEEEWEKVSTRVSHLLRLQLEVHERLSSKPLSDPILEPMLSAVPDPFNAYSSATGSSSSSVNGLDGNNGGEIFSILQNSALLGQAGQASSGHAMRDDDILTPAGLLSPRTPATGLSRGRSGAPSASSQNQRDSYVSTGNSLPSPRLNAANGPGAESNHTGGGVGEISFAALGLTSATHPQAFAAPSALGSAGSIGSPLFGSEDGSQQGDAADTSERKTAGDREDGLFNEASGHSRNDDERSESDITAIPASISSPSASTAQDPKTPTRKTSSKKKKAKGKSAVSTASSSLSEPPEPTASSTTATAPTARPISASSASIGLSQRLKKALSIIDDKPEGETSRGGDAQADADDSATIPQTSSSSMPPQSDDREKTNIETSEAAAVAAK